ncbi:carbohydrate esterase family 9 protein [Collybia nuda]|uniref:Carbohydrate esterase family 9 protein n=1 Tax=Collybia nuda TaxID=64659 RepID=A0A9P5Y598_9AGAR|nr:carbohydrate esterase family 9 protein [Collybia nuda]
MDKLPSHIREARKARPSPIFKLFAIAIAASVASLYYLTLQWTDSTSFNIPINAAEILQKCQSFDIPPGPPQDFHLRAQSDRFQAGTQATLLKNATVWTGRVSGYEIIQGDILLDMGLIKAIGHVEQSVLDTYTDLMTIDIAGAWVTPGIVDMHSHLGVDSSPSLNGASDTNSLKGLVLPWLRSLDALNTHDDAYRLSISGGVTTSVVLPGSADAIGGQAFPIKLRPTVERTPSSMLLEPPYSLNGSYVDPALPPRWRQMKHACGENPSRVYAGTRMDTIWAFRQGYDTARTIKQSQDAYCAKALSGQWNNLGPYPESLQWEALIDVLRGRVKIHNHCYEAVDLDGIVRLSNEFKFPIAAFHHAHETYLVPNLIKKAYGRTPAVALFATNGRYKREAYRGSEFAPRILADNDLRVVMKSDHPVLNSRHLVYEAQQAHYYGLPHNLALAAITSTPATVIGLDHRIGFLSTGYDADVIVWDSHPLALGATPKQVYIDGIAQIEEPFSIDKGTALQHVPDTPNFDKEAEETLKYDGLPPLEPHNASSHFVIFTNVGSIFARRGHTIREVFTSMDAKLGTVIVENGTIVCMGTCSTTSASLASGMRVDLEGGSISPALLSYGSPLGLENINQEPSTNDGNVFDPLSGAVPGLLGGDGSVIRAVDGLLYSTRDALLAYRAGVTTGVVAPTSRGFLSGLSTAFNTGVVHKLKKGAIVQDVTALHVAVGSSAVSTSTQIAALRRLLFGGGQGDLASSFSKVTKGIMPLVVQVQSADIMASLIRLKSQVESHYRNSIQMTFSGASEAHLLAKEIADAKVGVIITSPRPFPATWESKRILPSHPLTKESAISHLLSHNVKVGMGTEEQWNARNLRFDVAWASLDANDMISRGEALALASVNLETLLGIKAANTDLVATRGGSILSFEGKIVSIISPGRGVVDLL